MYLCECSESGSPSGGTCMDCLLIKPFQQITLAKTSSQSSESQQAQRSALRSGDSGFFEDLHSKDKSGEDYHVGGWPWAEKPKKCYLPNRHKSELVESSDPLPRQGWSNFGPIGPMSKSWRQEPQRFTPTTPGYSRSLTSWRGLSEVRSVSIAYPRNQPANIPVSLPATKFGYENGEHDQRTLTERMKALDIRNAETISLIISQPIVENWARGALQLLPSPLYSAIYANIANSCLLELQDSILELHCRIEPYYRPKCQTEAIGMEDLEKRLSIPTRKLEVAYYICQTMTQDFSLKISTLAKTEITKTLNSFVDIAEKEMQKHHQMIELLRTTSHVLSVLVKLDDMTLKDEGCGGEEARIMMKSVYDQLKPALRIWRAFHRLFKMGNDTQKIFEQVITRFRIYKSCICPGGNGGKAAPSKRNPRCQSLHGQEAEYHEKNMALFWLT